LDYNSRADYPFPQQDKVLEGRRAVLLSGLLFVLPGYQGIRGFTFSTSATHEVQDHLSRPRYGIERDNLPHIQ
jgi:hypothetical protein